MITMIQPFGDRVLVKPIVPEQKTSSGLYIPDTAREAPQKGNVIAVGEGSPLQAKLDIGDQILFQKFTGVELSLDDGKYILLNESDILGRIIEGDAVR